MRILLWGFGADSKKNIHAPNEHKKNCVVYTGTHDNNTAKGWFETEADPEQKKRLFDYLGRDVSAAEVHCQLVRLAMNSAANLAIIPLQDILGLGADARMNLPVTVDKNNWTWRLGKNQITPAIINKLKEITELSDRG